MNKLRIVPIGGGPGMVTNNMYLYEWGNEAIVIDCGIGFPDDKESNDILIPDITYLKTNPKKILGVILTHGHDDHIAALPHILPALNSPPVYGSKLTAGFAQDRLRDFGLQNKVNVLKENDKLRLGPFTIEPIHVTHSVPNTYHYVITTPIGSIYHGSDFKFDLTPVDGQPPDFKKIASLSKKGIICLLSDCLRSERKGFNRSESSIAEALRREISSAKGRVVFTTMSSQIHRIQQAVDVAVSHGRQIAFVGRSMERNTQTASQLGFLHLPKKAIININKAKKVKDNRLFLIVAGSQGQESSSLTRYASGTHRLLKPKPNDKVVYSADIIPGNEQPVFAVIDQMIKSGLSVTYQETAGDLHVSGHASAGELQLLMELVNSHYLYPIGGTFRHMKQYQKLGEQIGYRKDQMIMPKTSQVVEFDQSGYYKLGEVLKLSEVRINQNEVRPKRKK